MGTGKGVQSIKATKFDEIVAGPRLVAGHARQMQRKHP
jgi:hypothetical protein